MEKNYINNDTFLAKWLNNELSEAELSDFKASEDYPLFEKIAQSSQKFKIDSEFDQQKTFEAIQQKINQQEKPTKVVSLFPKWIYGVAAAVAVLLGITFFMNSSEKVSTAFGEQLAYTLPDGSVVTLNGDSELKFNAKQWEQGKRTLSLSGEGYFKVQKGSTFRVKTNQGTISVLGTQFNVLTRADYLNVKCYEGKVSVATDENKVILLPGNGTYIQNGAFNATEFTQITPLWQQKRLVFESAPLSVVFHAIKNQFAVNIDVKKVDEKQLFTGEVLTKNLEIALQSVCLPMDIKYSILGKQVVLKK